MWTLLVTLTWWKLATNLTSLPVKKILTCPHKEYYTCTAIQKCGVWISGVELMKQFDYVVLSCGAFYVLLFILNPDVNIINLFGILSLFSCTILFSLYFCVLYHFRFRVVTQ